MINAQTEKEVDIPSIVATALEQPEVKLVKVRRRDFLEYGFPDRHIRKVNELLTGTGTWFERYGELKDKLIQGFLVGLIGKRGTGKTQLATMLAYEVLHTGRTAHYSLLSEFFMMLKNCYKEGYEGDTDAMILRRYAKYDLLVFDEVHEIQRTPFETEMFTMLIDKRYCQPHTCTILILSLIHI